MLWLHTQSREGQTSHQGSFGGLSGGWCCAKWSVQKKTERKKAELYASSSTFGRVTTLQGNRADGGQKCLPWARALFLSHFMGIRTQPGCVKSQIYVYVVYRPLPSSLCMRTIMKHLNQLFLWGFFFFFLKNSYSSRHWAGTASSEHEPENKMRNSLIGETGPVFPGHNPDLSPLPCTVLWPRGHRQREHVHQRGWRTRNFEKPLLCSLLSPNNYTDRYKYK